MDESLRGQTNGLLGAATGDALSIVTATHTGLVRVRLEWHDREPVVDPTWTDVVEAPLTIGGRDMRLETFDDTYEVRAPTLGSHRARLCAAGFEAASTSELNAETDRYLLQLWPAAASPDAIGRVSGLAAQRWHDEARSLTTIPDDQWAAGQATYTAAVRPWRPAADDGLAEADLLDEISAGFLNIELRHPLARMACEAAGIAHREPIRSALQALRGWEPLPATMTSPDVVLAKLRRDSGEHAQAPSLRQDSMPDQVELAVRALLAAADPDSVENLTPLLDLTKLTTQRTGKDLLREALTERGYG